MLAMDNHSFDSPTELVKRQGLYVLGLNITVSCLHLYEVLADTYSVDPSVRKRLWFILFSLNEVTKTF